MPQLELTNKFTVKSIKSVEAITIVSIISDSAISSILTRVWIARRKSLIYKFLTE